jgi:hypothetical protein
MPGGFYRTQTWPTVFAHGARSQNARFEPHRIEFDYIVAQGFARELQPWEVADRARDPAPEPAQRPLVDQVVRRPFRDEAFRRHVREAYGNTCAVTGLCLLNGGGRPEVQAAHIRAVEANGPDTVRNGLVLTATVHWMFDRGLILSGRFVSIAGGEEGTSFGACAAGAAGKVDSRSGAAGDAAARCVFAVASGGTVQGVGCVYSKLPNLRQIRELQWHCITARLRR